MAVDTRTYFDDPLPMGLSIVVSQQDATTTMALDGEWDLVQRERTRAAVRSVLASHPDRVVLDLSRLTFMDSTGIQGVLELADHAAHLKMDLVVVPGPQAIQRLFEICQLSEFFTFADAA